MNECNHSLSLSRAPSTSGGTATGGDRGTPCRAPMTNPLSTPRAPRERASARRESDLLERAAVRERAGSAVEPVSGASERRAHARNAGRSCHGQKVACWRVDVALRVHLAVWRERPRSCPNRANHANHKGKSPRIARIARITRANHPQSRVIRSLQIAGDPGDLPF